MNTYETFIASILRYTLNGLSYTIKNIQLDYVFILVDSFSYSQIFKFNFEIVS